jgi:hypothetical protein
VRRLLAPYELEPLSEGIQARVFRVRGLPWVVKEARWDLELPLHPRLSLPLDAALFDRLWALVGFDFLPRPSFVLRQYQEYLSLVRYFGVSSPAWAKRHPALAAVRNDQLTIRRDLLARLAPTLRRHRLPVDPLAQLISQVRDHNFLPEEYLLFGPSLSAQNEGLPTSFIVQAFVSGQPLHDIDPLTLPRDSQAQLTLLLLLMLLLHEEEGLVPDTRPRSLLTQGHEWLLKTDNILIGPATGVTIVDTRWCWRTRGNLAVRGGPIPDLTLLSARQLLRKLAKLPTS